MSVRLNEDELARLARFTCEGRKTHGQVFRELLYGARAVVVPAINEEHWTQHARTLSNLNQIAAALNRGELSEDVRPILHQLVLDVHALRAELRGAPSGQP